MDFHQLRYFLEIARQEHMGKAARVLAITQSALSHAISALEEDLGVSLFAREGRRIFLNASGQRLLERGEKLLREKQMLEDEIRSQSGELYGTIRVAAPIAINAHFLGPVWAKVAAEHSQVRAEISSLRSIEVVPKAVAGEIDLGICFGPQAHPLLENSTLSKRKLLAAVSKTRWRWIDKTMEESLETLSSMPTALPRDLLGFGHGETHPFYERHKIRPNHSLLYDNYEVAITFITNNPAWALLPDWVCELFSDVIKPVHPDRLYEPLEITAIWPKRRRLSPITKLLDAELKAAFKVKPKLSRKAATKSKT